MPEDLPRPVQVRHDDGHWYDGWLEAVRHDENGWHGYVRYTVSPGATHVLWFGEDRIRAPLVRPEHSPTATSDDTHDSKSPGQSGSTPPDLHREQP